MNNEVFPLDEKKVLEGLELFNKIYETIIRVKTKEEFRIANEHKLISKLANDIVSFVKLSKNEIDGVGFITFNLLSSKVNGIQNTYDFSEFDGKIIGNVISNAIIFASAVTDDLLQEIQTTIKNDLKITEYEINLLLLVKHLLYIQLNQISNAILNKIYDDIVIITLKLMVSVESYNNNLNTLIEDIEEIGGVN